MNKAYFDWRNIKAIKTFFENYNFDNITSINQINNYDLIFIHTGNNDVWKKKAKDNSDKQFVFINTVTIKGEHDSDNIHYCLYPADKLKDYKKAIDFFEKLENEVDWSLLQPEPIKTHLIALSILCQGYLAANAPKKIRLLKEVAVTNKKLTLQKDWWKPALGDDYKEDKLDKELETITKNIEDIKLIEEIRNKKSQYFDDGNNLKSEYIKIFTEIVNKSFLIIEEVL